ncbi:D-alanyl-D-alanine carboxypeptidase family protein [Streptosporangium sp. NBC_01755]|uniref:D-alanyl-D-alanine carboxypeptidase family protein n=1 Tax=Streptosporangium sp. NBC_01755 TaxID=2975949 RepID=UPI002DD90294|nr:D-alanyl-D-alanine carboxypeptidase family protein [Streptosporangium sp. NBC_01755]WSD02574.1 D-alanyl-D-alanine carboxypeptidase family protein [Streptosporangium sp. NBC_01755]
MPPRRSAGLIAVVATMLSLLPGAAAAQRAPGEVQAVVAAEPVNLTELRREAEKATKDLEAATKALEQRRTQIRDSEKQLTAKLRELQVAERAFEQVRQPLSDLVGLLYQQPISGEVAGFLSGESNTDTLRAMAGVTQLVAEQDLILKDSSRLQLERERLAGEAQELRATNLLAEAQMGAEIETLRARSQKIVQSLTKALVKLGVKINKNGQPAAGCDPTRATSMGDFPNGLIPQAYLCPLQQPGNQLRGDAALAFISLNEAYKRRFGRPICVTDSYRNLAEQQSVYYRRPGFAAVPGRSNHGLGLAVDLCGGVERFRSAEFNWVEANGKQFGWIHPQWAYVSPFEPWHWEYDPKLGSLL